MADMTTVWPKVSIGQQGESDLKPGSGIVQVESGDGCVAQFTHYQYGSGGQ